jgi:7,8-dihydroneopterin aldolase/epimerase/oxygenase
MRDGQNARDGNASRVPLDIIFVRDIRLETLIGAYEFERRQPRTLQVNIEIGRRALRACKTDQLADTIDYSDVVGVVREVFASHAFHLLEPLAELLADRLLTRFDANWISIEISKTGIVPNARDVGVRIERSRGATDLR